ncbi:MAG TPA: alpha/beta hydrolase [Nevskia sp.]|nr:alpha/beta hydrolase [Nevskia sp.]
MPYAQVNGQKLYYEDTGGGGPAVVFSHGLLMDQTMFAPQVAALKDRYRCISWDERGHGRTAGDSLAPFTYYDSADDLAALLDHLGVKQAVLAGMSQGGYLSLRCALTHPQIVRALILIDTQAGLEDPAKMPGYQQMMDIWARQGLPDAIADTIEQIILGQNWAGAAAWKEKWRGWKAANLLQCFHTLGERDDLRPRLGEIRVPALVVHGDLDMAISLDRGKALAEGLLQARLAVIKGGGHAANLTHPDQVNPHIEEFLAALR